MKGWRSTLDTVNFFGPRSLLSLMWGDLKGLFCKFIEFFANYWIKKLSLGRADSTMLVCRWTTFSACPLELVHLVSWSFSLQVPSKCKACQFMSSTDCTLLCNPVVIQFHGWGRLSALPVVTLTGQCNPTLLCNVTVTELYEKQQ